MARTSVDTAKQALTTLLHEQERDRDNLQRMLVHSERMSEQLRMMRDEEENRIEQDAQERKTAVRNMFGQLLAIEDERKERLNMHIADIDGKRVLEAGPEIGATGTQFRLVNKSAGSQPAVQHR